MMNVVVVGNSNCVFRSGFVGGIEQEAHKMGGSVANYSLGGSCSAMHIYTFHSRFAELEQADLVVLDSLVIDSFHLKRGIIRKEELFSLVDDMYALYSTLPGKVIAMLFPTEHHADRYRSMPAYRAHMRSAARYGVDVLDLYAALPEGVENYRAYFMQPSHLRLELASEIGRRLMMWCHGAKRNANTMPARSPYEVVAGELFKGLKSVDVASSHYVANCYRLDRQVSLKEVAGKSLIGVMHWNKDAVSRIVLSTSDGVDVLHLRSKYAFFEVLNSRRTITAASAVRPGRHDEVQTQKPAGKNRQAEYGIPQLAGMLLRGEGPVTAVVKNHHAELSSQLGALFG